MLNLANNMDKKLQAYFLNNWFHIEMDFQSMWNVNIHQMVYTLLIEWLNETKERVKYGEKECRRRFFMQLITIPISGPDVWLYDIH